MRIFPFWIYNDNVCIANYYSSILQKNVSKEGENNSQFMTRESEARSCAQKQTRYAVPLRQLVEIFIEISFHPIQC